MRLHRGHVQRHQHSSPTARTRPGSFVSIYCSPTCYRLSTASLASIGSQDANCQATTS